MTTEPTVATSPKRHFTRRYLLLASGLILGCLFAGYHFIGGKSPDIAANKNPTGKRGGVQNQAQPVSVGEVSKKDIHLWLPAIGTAIPRNLVTIRSRVDGELLSLHFKEGDSVKKGQLLAELDARPYQAQLIQVTGQLNRDLALLQNAKTDLQRYQELWSKDSIAKQQVDTQAALVRQYEGTVENDRGLVDSAKLQVAYSRITAPVSGRISLRQVDPGNQIHASDSNGLASIAQIEPMTVVFSVPEGQLPEINRRLESGESLLTEAWDREQKNHLSTGHLLTTDNQIDPTTGTIKLKAEFANSDHHLFPNQFVNTRLLLGIKKDTTVIPAAAIMRGSSGTFVYRVNPEGIVNSVTIMPGAVDGEEVEVVGELKAGDRLVTDGGDKLRDGAKVDVINAENHQAGNGDKRASRPNTGGYQAPGKNPPNSNSNSNSNSKAAS